MLSQVDNIEGDWKIIDFTQHPELIGCRFKITHDDKDLDTFHLQVHIVNTIKCTFQYVSDFDPWNHSAVESTKMAGPPEKLNQERGIVSFIDSIENLEVLGGEQLIVRTVDGDLILLEHPQEDNQSLNDK